MNDQQQQQSEPALTYPRPWEYTVIGPDPDGVRAAIGEVVGSREHSVAAANASRTGKYHSLRVELIVDSEADRDALFFALRDHDNVKMVL